MILVNKIIDNIVKDYKKLGKITLSEYDVFKDINSWITTNVPELNYFIQTPGIPVGKIIELAGKEQSGKTTLGYHITTGAQLDKSRPVFVVWFSMERRTYKGYPSMIGAIERLCIVEKPKTLEEMFSLMEWWISDLREKYGEDFLILFVVDSIGGAVSKREEEGEASDEHIAVPAKVIKKNLRRILNKLDDENVALVLINQIIDRIGVPMFAKKTISSGGRSIKFHSCMRLELTDVAKIKIGTTGLKIGQMTKIELIKCDFSSPYRIIELPLLFGIGFVPSKDAIAFALEDGLIDKKQGRLKFLHWEWKKESDYYNLCKDNKFRRLFIRLLDIRYRKLILEERNC